MTTVSGLGELNGAGHTVATDGNVQVDFVWGNLPLQPNDDREGNNLDPFLDNHSIAYDGWSNYPGYIPNYYGDEDSQLEFVVPDLLRLTRSAAEALLNAENLNLFDVAHTLTVSYLESVGTGGKTVRVSAYDHNNPQDNAYLNGLRVGDFVVVDNNEQDFGGEVKVTKINEDGENSWFEFKTETALNLDTSATGTVYAGSNLVDLVTVQRFWNASGSIKNPGTNVHVRYFEAAPVGPAALIGPTTNWYGRANGISLWGITTLPTELSGSGYMGYNIVISGGVLAGTHDISSATIAPGMNGDYLRLVSTSLGALLDPILPNGVRGATDTNSPFGEPLDAGIVSVVAI